MMTFTYDRTDAQQLVKGIATYNISIINYLSWVYNVGYLEQYPLHLAHLNMTKKQAYTRTIVVDTGSSSVSNAMGGGAITPGVSIVPLASPSIAGAAELGEEYSVVVSDISKDFENFKHYSRREFHEDY